MAIIALNIVWCMCTCAHLIVFHNAADWSSFWSHSVFHCLTSVFFPSSVHVFYGFESPSDANFVMHPSSHRSPRTPERCIIQQCACSPYSKHTNVHTPGKWSEPMCNAAHVCHDVWNVFHILGPDSSMLSSWTLLSFFDLLTTLTKHLTALPVSQSVHLHAHWKPGERWRWMRWLY